MIHLHVRSCYSLLESGLTIEDIIRLAQEHHQKTVVLTDHRTMYGTMEFLHAAKNAGLKPVIGLEFEIEENGNLYSLLAIAKNGQGLQNLYQISTWVMSHSQPMPINVLKAFGANLILMNAGGDEVLENMAYQNMVVEIATLFQTLEQIADSFYVAISLQDSPRFAKSNATLELAANSLDLPCVALSRVEYEHPQDERTLRLLRAIGQTKSMDDPTIQARKGRYYRSEKEMASLYSVEQLANTDQIIDQIEDYEIPKANLPIFPNRVGAQSDIYLKELCIKGLKKRFNQNVPSNYWNRLQMELDVILSMGFSDYFLIVWDFIREARSRSILVGPGRGSAAGSLVAWTLGISHVDPVANSLLFERFLNPSRISMPDIDTDFPDNRRQEILDYVQETYGKYHVAHIVTFSRMKSRSALRDCARAMNVSNREISQLTQLVPNNSEWKLAELPQHNSAFKHMIESRPRLQAVYQAACSIEGFPRHASLHAGGIVLARDSIVQQAPLVDVGEHLPVVQFTMEYLEEIGLIKFDFLSLKNLTLIASMLEVIEKQEGKKIDLLKLPLDDPKVYLLLQNAQTMGVFQLESAGIRDLLIRYKPEKFEDIAAVLALYRPGPMKNIDTFLKARFNRANQKSMHPLLDPILKETGGIFVYQEQIMEAAKVIGGFSLAQADMLRKAMSKKKPEEMAKWQDQFVEGAKEKGIDSTTAQEIFGVMFEFAEYGFNKSHSYVYGLIVYQMCWLKVNYPLAFYQVLLDSCIGSGAKTNIFIQEARSRGISFLPFSLNHSFETYSQQVNGLRLPFSLIQSINRPTIERIIQERHEHGLYQDPCLSVIRLIHIGLSNQQVEALIQVGTLDELKVTRETLIAQLEQIISFADLITLEGGTWQFAGVTPPVLHKMPINNMERIKKEKELLGFYITRHPATLLRQKNRQILSLESALKQNGHMQIAGIIQSIRPQKTKKGDQMAFATLADDTGTLDIAIMPIQWQRVQTQLETNKLVILQVNKNRPDSAIFNGMQIIDVI